jgi:hypothetical protein
LIEGSDGQQLAEPTAAGGTIDGRQRAGGVLRLGIDPGLRQRRIGFEAPVWIANFDVGDGLADISLARLFIEATDHFGQGSPGLRRCHSAASVRTSAAGR